MNSIARFVSLSIVVIAFPSSAAASQLLYDINFSEPFHTVGNPASLDKGETPRRGPSKNSFQFPKVASSFGPLTNGALRFTSPDESSPFILSQIQLGIENQFTGVGVDLPEYRLEFDVVIENLGIAGDDFTILFDSPSVSRFSFRGDGLIQVGNGANFIGTFDEGDLIHVAVAFQTDDEMWQIKVNGKELYSGPTQSDAMGGLGSIRLSLSDNDIRDSEVYVDNIVVTGIPEPATAPLFALMLLGSRRRPRGMR